MAAFPVVWVSRVLEYRLKGYRVEPEIPSTMTMREIIAHNIKTLRKSGVQEGQAAFAERLKTLDPSKRAWSVNRVSEAERGERNFTMDDLVLFARALGKPVSRLMLIPVGVESIRMDNGENVPRSALQDSGTHPDAPEEYLLEVGRAVLDHIEKAEELEKSLGVIGGMIRGAQIAAETLAGDSASIHSLTATARRDILRHKRGNAPEVGKI